MREKYKNTNVTPNTTIKKISSLENLENNLLNMYIPPQSTNFCSPEHIIARTNGPVNHYLERMFALCYMR